MRFHAHPLHLLFLLVVFPVLQEILEDSGNDLWGRESIDESTPFLEKETVHLRQLRHWLRLHRGIRCQMSCNMRRMSLTRCGHHSASSCVYLDESVIGFQDADFQRSSQRAGHTHLVHSNCIATQLVNTRQDWERGRRRRLQTHTVSSVPQVKGNVGNSHLSKVVDPP